MMLRLEKVSVEKSVIDKQKFELSSILPLSILAPWQYLLGTFNAQSDRTRNASLGNLIHRTGVSLSSKMTPKERSATRKRPARSEISPPPKRSKRVSTTEVKPTYKEESDVDEDEVKITIRKTLTKNRISHKAQEDEDTVVSVKQVTKVEKKVKVEQNGPSAETSQETNGTETKVKRKPRKTKEEKIAEAMPLAARTIGSKLLVGAHVSAAGGKRPVLWNLIWVVS
jgi:AP endonuclease-1